MLPFLHFHRLIIILIINQRGWIKAPEILHICRLQPLGWNLWPLNLEGWVLSIQLNRREFVLTKLDSMTDTFMSVDGTTKCSLISRRTGPGTKILPHLLVMHSGLILNTSCILVQACLSVTSVCALSSSLHFEFIWLYYHPAPSPVAPVQTFQWNGFYCTSARSQKPPVTQKTGKQHLKMMPDELNSKTFLQIMTKLEKTELNLN